VKVVQASAGVTLPRERQTRAELVAAVPEAPPARVAQVVRLVVLRALVPAAAAAVPVWAAPAVRVLQALAPAALEALLE
jgi:hypothetical protein